MNPQRKRKLTPLTIAFLLALSPAQTLAEEPSEKIPGIDPDKPLSEQLDEDKGVIAPPPIGDEGIHAEVPNPEAGHKEEVIPPPDTPGGDPNIEPK